MTANVLVVLTNWKRPRNVVEIARAMRQQTVAIEIVIVDNSPPGQKNEFGLPWEAGALADDVWRINRNLGPPCRWAPALMNYTADYTLLFDDDLLPGPQCVESFLATAKLLNDQFATLGQIGRIFERNPPQYVRRNIACDSLPVKVDATCRAHFVQTRRIHEAQELRRHLSPLSTLCGLEWNDDLAICLGIQRASNLPSYLCPESNRESSIRFRELASPHAVNSRDDHLASRTHFIQQASRCGWQSRV